MPLRSVSVALLLAVPALAQQTPAAPATTAPALSPDALWAKASESIVTLETNEGSGLGILVQFKGTVCLITSQDTLMKTRTPVVKTKSGKVLPVTRFFLSEDGAVALGRFDKAPEGISALEAIPDPTQLAPKQKLLSAFQDKSLQESEVKSVGKEEIELNASRTPKPSQPGTPVINPADGKVVGIFTPVTVYEVVSGVTAAGKERLEYFKPPQQVRLSRWDKVEKWVEFNPARARDEGMRLNRFHEHTRQVGLFLMMGENFKEPCDVTRAFQKYSDDIRRERLDLSYYLGQHSQFLSYFPVLAQREVDTLKRDHVHFYPWNRLQGAEMLKARATVFARATEAIKANSGPFAKPSGR